MKDQNNISLAQEAYVKKHYRKKRWIMISRIFILIVFIGLWELSVQIGLLDAFIFSSPVRMAKSLIVLVKSGEIFLHVGITLLETMISFILVLVLGVGIAIVLWWNDSISKTIEPYLIALNSLPKTALAPILIVWLGNNMKTIVVCAILLAVFGTIINLYTDYAQTDPDKILLVRTLGGSKRDVLFKVVIPQNLPALISSMKVNIGLCLVGVIIGEFLAANAGLGYLIIYSSQVFRLDYVMLSIVVLCIIATVLYSVLNLFEKRYNKQL